MADRLDPDISLPFPIEFMIRETPRSHQSENTRGKEAWRQTVRSAASAHAETLTDFYFLDDRPLAATIFYFPPTAMQGDIDNIAKLIIDGMIAIIYPDDRLLERIVVQKFEPGLAVIFRSLTPTLEKAAATDPPVVYIRIDDDLSWRQVP